MIVAQVSYRAGCGTSAVAAARGAAWAGVGSRWRQAMPFTATTLWPAGRPAGHRPTFPRGRAERGSHLPSGLLFSALQNFPAVRTVLVFYGTVARHNCADLRRCLTPSPTRGPAARFIDGRVCWYCSDDRTYLPPPTPTSGGRC